MLVRSGYSAKMRMDSSEQKGTWIWFICRYLFGRGVGVHYGDAELPSCCADAGKKEEHNLRGQHALVVGNGKGNDHQGGEEGEERNDDRGRDLSGSQDTDTGIAAPALMPPTMATR